MKNRFLGTHEFEEELIFVGRKNVLGVLKRELIERNHAAIITGPAGVGKTYLARFFANKNKHFSPDGIYFERDDEFTNKR